MSCQCFPTPPPGPWHQGLSLTLLALSDAAGWCRRGICRPWRSLPALKHTTPRVTSNNILVFQTFLHYTHTTEVPVLFCLFCIQKVFSSLWKRNNLNYALEKKCIIHKTLVISNNIVVFQQLFFNHFYITILHTHCKSTSSIYNYKNPHLKLRKLFCFALKKCFCYENETTEITH